MKASALVRTARLRSALTQRELAERTRISQPMISLIESGQQDPVRGVLGHQVDDVHKVPFPESFQCPLVGL